MTKGGFGNLDEDSENRMSTSGCLVAFSDQIQNYCVGMLDPRVNMCFKINHSAETNGTDIGENWHKMVKSFDECKFNKIEELLLGFGNKYPVYSTERKKCQ